MVFHLDDRVIPILLEFDRRDGLDEPFLVVMNGEERIVVEDVSFRMDSIFIRMPLYDSEFLGVVRNDRWIDGQWMNHTKGPGYRIPFTARAGEDSRFQGAPSSNVDVSGQWAVHFDQGAEKAYQAIGVFEQHADGRATGTFITETGDYRFLEGAVLGDSLMLSSFDGSRAMLFSARLQGDSLEGMFWSGTHWKEPWQAMRDDHFTLRDPDSLTALREGYSTVEFSFPDLDGNTVTSSDERFKGNPYLLQVMGSWCSNCADEARSLNEIHEAYSDRGLEVVALAFEKHEDPVRVRTVLERFKRTLGITYPILYAGRAVKEEVLEKLPFLDRMMSYPTCVFVDHTGQVRRIHTGSYGPGTGVRHQQYMRDLRSFVELMLLERDNANALRP